MPLYDTLRFFIKYNMHTALDKEDEVVERILLKIDRREVGDSLS